MLNEGRCMRADCRFAHDLKQITCKYWIDGECLKGDNCEFLHELIEESIQPMSSKLSASKKAPKPIVIKKKDFKLDTEEFPALGGPPPSVPKTCEFPPLGASPISINQHVVVDAPLLNCKKSSSPETAQLIVKSSPPQTQAKNNLALFKTAASVLKATSSNTAVNNLVQNKPQQAAKAQKQNNITAPHLVRAGMQKSSCGTSPSSSCGESMSRGCNVTRSNKK